MADSIYKQLRKSLKLSRDDVCNKATDIGMPIQPERLERIENGKFEIHPEEVMLLAAIYGEPSLCNAYCSRECPIGQKYVPPIEVKELPQTVLETLASLNALKDNQELFIKIAADGKIDDNEIKDFVAIQRELEKISLSVEALQFWVEEMISQGKINKSLYEKHLNQQ